MPKFTFEPRLRWKNYLPPPKSDHYEWNVALSSNKSDVSDEKQRVASHVCMLLTAKVKVHSQTVVSTIKHLKTGNRNRHSLSINPTEVIQTILDVSLVSTLTTEAFDDHQNQEKRCIFGYWTQKRWRMVTLSFSSCRVARPFPSAACVPLLCYESSNCFYAIWWVDCRRTCL